MSALGSGEVLKPILLRSFTPAPNEKVLNYLEGMSREGNEVDNTPPRSMVDPNEFRSKAGSTRNGLASPKIYSPAPRSQTSEALLDLANSPMSYGNRNGEAHDYYEEDGDADSNVQDGLRSEAGETVLPVREPGPHDPPGPKYESYDSGPSFGNFGPLPTDDHPPASSNPYANGSWNPDWANQGSVVSGHPARVPLPPSELPTSPRGTSVHLDGENQHTKSRTRNSQAPSRASHKAPSAMSERRPDEPTSPRAPSRIQSRNGDYRAMSPLSRVTTKTRTSEKGTVYPPLPESRVDEETNYGKPQSVLSRSHARSKAPSVSPSDSPSQAKAYSKTPSRKDPSNFNKSMHTPTEMGGEPVGEFSPRSGSRQLPHNGASRSQPPGSVMSGGHQSRPFSPYRHAPTTEDLLYAAVRGRSIAIPEEDEKSTTTIPSPSRHSAAPSAVQSRHSKAPSAHTNGKSHTKSPSATSSRQAQEVREADVTPTPSRPHSPVEPVDLDQEEAEIVREALLGRTPRTSYYAASTLEPEIANHYHDHELCLLLKEESDKNVHEVVKRALRKAIRQRVKKLGMKYDNETMNKYKNSYHDDPSSQPRNDYPPDQDPPQWASDIKREIVLMQQRIESLGPKIEGLRPAASRSYGGDGSKYGHGYEGDDYTRTPMTQTVNIHTQPNGTFADSMYQAAGTELVVDDEGHHDDHDYDDMTATPNPGFLRTDGETRTQNRSAYALSEGRDDSPGQQFLEEELYKLRQKPQGSQSARSHRTWEVARDEDHHEEYDDEHEHGPAPSGLPTIPDSNGDNYPEREHSSSPPLPPLPDDGNREIVPTPQPWNGGEYGGDGQQQFPPWQRIHQRLLSWAIIWPSSELDHALNSTTRGHQVDEVALSIWSTQTYKRYVRARLTDSPQGVVDRLFVPPNMADAISNAVFNGRHGDACGMLRDLWSPFGLEGMPRLLVVLAKHRSDENHWVVHRFSLPDGALTTYDSYPERTLPDGRPLGWWFAIRIAWPNAIYPNPDHLMQKMVRLHRPMQLPIDNSVAAAGIWRNILMGSRAERSLDLERLRDLINTEVKNLRQRKQLGKLSIGAPRPAWEDMN